jgi:ABC-type Fe3+ transport system permease subunit/DNA-binding beta-propeller fold protein YncE
LGKAIAGIGGSDGGFAKDLSAMNWSLLQNSLLVAGLATVFSVGLGFAAALWARGLGIRLRMIFAGLAVVALALPPFLVTNTWLHFLGYTGVWREWLPLNIFSLWGTVWVLVLLTWPITLLLTMGSWSQLEQEQLEIDPALGGGRLVRWLLIPVAKPALGQAAVLTFVLTLNQFSVPAILQTKVFPAEVWLRFNTTFDHWGALWLSWPMVLGPLLLLVWFSRKGVIWPRVQGAAPAWIFRRTLGPAWFWGCGLAAVLVVGITVALPLGQLMTASRTWAELNTAFAAGQRAVWNSFLFAAAAAGLCMAAGMLSWRRRGGALLWLIFLVPGVLLGIGLILLLNRPVLAAFYQSAGMVILGLTVRYLALGWAGARHAMKSVDADLVDWARLHGGTRWDVFRQVQWPQIAPAMLAAGYVIYLLCLWDVETLVLIVPPGGETLAIRIFNLLHYGHNIQVNALCILLLGLAVLPLLVWGGWRGMRFVAPQFGNAGKAGWKLTMLVALGAGGAGLTGCAPASGNGLNVQSRFFSQVEVIGTRGAGLGQFNKPRSVAVDKEDNLYVVDMTGRVQKFSPEGEFLLFWQMFETDLGRPKGMCQDGDGNVVVIEPHYSRVNHFSTAGTLESQWGDNGIESGQLMFPRSAAVNSQGAIYVSEYGRVERVQKFAAFGGKWLGSLGRAGAGPGEFNRAEGMGIDREDRVYVADSCNHRIQIFCEAGDFLRSYGRAGSGPGELSYPFDIRVDPWGYQYVCEFGNSRIQIFGPDDEPVEILGGIGSGPGQFSNPWGIAFDSAGNLYVADGGNHRVQKFVRRKTALFTGGRSGFPHLSPGAVESGPSEAPSLSLNRNLNPSQRALKFEIRNPKPETNPKTPNPKSETGHAPALSHKPSVSNFKHLLIRLCFGFRASDFEFSFLRDFTKKNLILIVIVLPSSGFRLGWLQTTP